MTDNVFTTLINNAAKRLKDKQPELTIQQARTQIRKTHPQWADYERNHGSHNA